jgi:flagellar protein FlaI
MAGERKAVTSQESQSSTEKKSSVFREVYPITEPNVYAALLRDPASQKMHYEVIEPTLRKEEERYLDEIKAFLMEELDVSVKDLETKENTADYLKRKVALVIRNYKLKIPPEAVEKLMYYVVRDYVGYGKIDPLMRDHMIEDISADGVGVPIYVWHREFESLPTNIIYKSSEELNSFIVRLAFMARKQISIASPLLDASLPDGSRIQMTYGNEITRRGSTFTIRRFRVDPLTISDLISLKTLSPEIAAYLWYAIENRASVLVAGGVATGKTTLLNCLSMFIKPEFKVVSVEDTAELNLPHENWIPSVARTSADRKRGGDVTLFDLLKAAVRQRPDYIIVGEVRGEEAYTLFQAMATGHLGMCTIHAESVDSAIHRLEAAPMNIPRSLLSMINIILVQGRTEINGKPARRALSVTEMVGSDPKTKDLLTNEVYHWNSGDDLFAYLGRSYVLERIIKKLNTTAQDVQSELQRRRMVLEWMFRNKIRKYTDVAGVIREYYADPMRVYHKARVGT